MKLYAAKFEKEVRPNVTQRIFITILTHGNYAVMDRCVTELSTIVGMNRVTTVKKERFELEPEIAQMMLLSGRFKQITNELWVQPQSLDELMHTSIPLIEESLPTE